MSAAMWRLAVTNGKRGLRISASDTSYVIDVIS